ncbi:acyl-CoA thioesterase [Planctellipticum variicoloris]|jgi:acyl-CoA thioester hydrolase|uniref:acyl-CoA thioesterase n=1 Tax=Planctellipticum variicoloris TaxID=3064265 RepID=UPI002B698766|nr:acyl-CoA thioesterase [Planctomycetaceae bacterium SH412]HTN01106.1 acyl-CoA thioesterase [Planctomycetaceae bacterium]
MPAIFELRHRVRADEADELGHVSNLVYLKWMQSAAFGHSAARGWGMDEYRAINAGWVVRSHEIEYLRPAFPGDEVIVQTWIADLKKMTSLRRYQILRPHDNVRLAVAATNWAFIDFATHRLKRVPPEVAAAFVVIPDGPALPEQIDEPAT